jgi:hypothetical protein
MPLGRFGWWDAPYGVGKWTEVHSAEHRHILAQKQALIAELAKADGRVVAGSTTLHIYGIPGASRHRGLELLVEAGLTPMQALPAATQMAAEWLGQEARLGTLAVGKVADLVILDGDPPVPSMRPLVASIGGTTGRRRPRRTGLSSAGLPSWTARSSEARVMAICWPSTRGLARCCGSEQRLTRQGARRSPCHR